MRVVKRLLLNAAAGFVAVAGAQAAGMPVKAKPVQYMRICTLYGYGFLLEANCIHAFSTPE